MVQQEQLRHLWLSAPVGRLCPWEQAKAVALRLASRELHSGQDNLQVLLIVFIRVYKEMILKASQKHIKV